MDDKEKEYLEHYVDKFGLKNVIDALVEIAHDKAAHIAENWNDTELAKIWHKRGDELAKVTINGE